jgi:hypothetical protein
VLESLVIVYPRRGTFASAINITSLSDITDVRAVLEAQAAAHAASLADRARERRDLLEAICRGNAAAARRIAEEHVIVVTEEMRAALQADGHSLMLSAVCVSDAGESAHFRLRGKPRRGRIDARSAEGQMEFMERNSTQGYDLLRRRCVPHGDGSR